MANVVPKMVVSMRLNGACVSHSRTDVSVRDLRTVIDEPVERGGTNQGPSPTETLMASLVGCTNVITHKVAARNGVRIHSMQVKLEAQFDRRGVQLMEEVDLPFPVVTLHIDLVTDADAVLVEKLRRELGMFCPVSKVFRAAGTEVKEQWTVRAP